MFLFDFVLVMFLLASDLCTGCRHTFSSQLPSSKINTTIDVDASSLKLSARAADLHHHTTASAAPFLLSWSTLIGVVVVLCFYSNCSSLSLSHRVRVWIMQFGSFLHLVILSDASFVPSITAWQMRPDVKTCCCIWYTAVTINTTQIPLVLAYCQQSSCPHLSGWKLSWWRNRTE